MKALPNLPNCDGGGPTTSDMLKQASFGVSLICERVWLKFELYDDSLFQILGTYDELSVHYEDLASRHVLCQREGLVSAQDDSPEQVEGITRW